MPKTSLSTFAPLRKPELLEIVRQTAGEDSIPSLMIVADRMIELPENSCSINIVAGEGVDEFMKKWTVKYLNGYSSRASARRSMPMGTIHDPIIDVIVSARLNHLSPAELDKIKYGHRIAMSAENIAGVLLEEYIALNIISKGWHCCWGETMKSIDFCNENDQLLQVKNSDNSENSSSKTVRDGTVIKHWFRRFSRTGATNWPALNALVGMEEDDVEMNEDGFKAFVRDTITLNPNLLNIEPSSPFNHLPSPNNES